jgi:hypothetical protein
MFSIQSLSLPALALATAVVALPALTPIDAQARERTATTTGPKGNTAIRSTNRAGGDVNSSTTTSGGKTMSRQVDRDGQGNTSATATGPRGQTATRETTRDANGSNTTVTGPNGQTGTVTVTR